METYPVHIADYISAHTSPEPGLLTRLSQETWQKVLMPRMLSGQVQGRFLSMVSKMLRPNRILEVGTYTGYSAICLAEGLAPGGRLTTIDVNDELKPMVLRYFRDAGISDSVDYHLGNALEVIPQLNGPFDLVFIDADKINYSAYFDLIIDKVRPGGLLLADNVLWSGKVADKGIGDKDTEALRKFNDKVQADERVENVLSPLRDGLMMMYKLV